MDHRVIWSPGALDDAEAIAAYIARDSVQYASAVARKLRDVARGLRAFPLSGRVVPELRDERIREKLIYSYRMIYRVEPARVTIAAIVHVRRSLDFESGRSRRT